MVILKDVTGKQLEVGDIIIRPVFSNLYRHIVLKRTSNGIYVSRALKFHDNIPKYCYSNYDERFNIDNHNSKMYISDYDVHDFIIVGKVNNIPDLPSKKKFDQLNKKQNGKEI